MIIFPAIDIKDGKCVRLKQGRADESTVFSSSPLKMAQLWAEQGSKWLHIIDLDGAFDGEPVNISIIKSICKELPDIKIQLGGGIRSLEIAAQYLDAGVTRLIIGTVALENPDLYAAMCNKFPGQIGVSLDAQGGRLKTKGWVEDSGLGVDDVLPRLVEQGTAFIVYTDIERDGMQSGINMQAMTELSAKSSIPVIAAGGVTALADVRELYPLSINGRLEGAITGRAIYEGTLKLHEALAWIEAQQKLGNPTLGE